MSKIKLYDFSQDADDAKALKGRFDGAHRTFNGFESCATLKVSLKGVFLEEQIPRLLELEHFRELASLITGINLSNEANMIIPLSLHSNHFENIAKFRAFKYITDQVNSLSSQKVEIQVCGVSNYLEYEQDFEVNNSLILTQHFFSALCSGAHFVWGRSYDNGKSAQSKRLVETTLEILKQESHIGKIIDPLSGSFLIENLTLKIIEETFKELKNLSHIANLEQLKEFLS